MKHRYYFGQLQRHILDAHKANPEARPARIVETLKKQKIETTAKYVSKTIRAWRKRFRWLNGKFVPGPEAGVKFQTGPARKGEHSAKPTAKRKTPQARKSEPRKKSAGRKTRASVR